MGLVQRSQRPEEGTAPGEAPRGIPQAVVLMGAPAQGGLPALRFDLLPMACIVFGPGLLIEGWNPKAEEIFGYRAGEVMGKNAAECLVFDEQSEAPGRLWERLRAAGGGQRHTCKNLTRDGRLLTCRWMSSPLLDPATGSMCAMLCLVEDITEEVRAAETLREAEAKYHGIFENAVEGIFQSTPEGHYLETNPALARMYGYGSPEELQLCVRDISTQLYVHRARRAEFVERIAREGEITAFESEVYRKDGSTLWISENVRIVRNEEGRVLCYEGMVEDISERKRAEADLFISDRAIQELDQGVFLADPTLPDHPAIYVNPAFCRLTGYSREELIGRNCRFLQGPETDPATVALLTEAIRAGQSCSVEILNYRKDGTPFWNALSISPVHDAEGRLVRFIGVQTDITAVRELQEQYRRSQKMEAFGQLAGGVAHDFNNLLSVILGYCEMALADVGPRDPLRPSLEQIESAGQRAAGLTRQLLAFSRKQTLNPKIINLNAVLADMEKMIRCLIGEGIELQIEPVPGVGAVRADRGQAEQVILNLAVNARDAMPQGGRLRIRTGHVTVGPGNPRPGVPAGEYVVLEVSDTGTGMTKEVQARLFEPFFTTKESGKGTGLGLATCYGIVRQSEGFITLESWLGAGSTFEIFLPRISGRAALPPAAPHVPAAPPRGSETILLVEDEAPVRDMTARFLRLLGYTVMEARNGLEARRLLSASLSGDIDLVMTDVGMPEMNGSSLAAWVRAHYADALPLMFLSGCLESALTAADLQNHSFLHKPVAPSEIARKIRETLER